MNAGETAAFHDGRRIDRIEKTPEALLREFFCFPASAAVMPLMIRNGGPPRRATGRKERPMPANLMVVLCPIRGIDIVPVPPIQLFF